MKLLHIDSSILGRGSVSRILSAEIVAALRASQPHIAVTYRDLAVNPIGYLTATHLAALGGAAAVDPSVHQDITAGKAALDEFLAADFSIPSQLKAWVDRIAVAGKTFRYTESGPEGLAVDKKLIIASSRGGFFGYDTPAASLDHQETYLRTLFGFLGVTDITFVRAEGVALGSTARDKAIEAAKGHLTRLAA